MNRSKSSMSYEFQMELMMVHLEQMNKRLDMLEKTCVVMMEKNTNAVSAQQYFDSKRAHDEAVVKSNPEPVPKTITSILRRAAL